MSYLGKLEAYQQAVMSTISKRGHYKVTVNIDPERDTLSVRISFYGIRYRKWFGHMSSVMRRQSPEYLAAICINEFHETLLRTVYRNDGWNVTDLLKIGTPGKAV